MHPKAAPEGYVTIAVDGVIVDEGHNLITTLGKAALAARVTNPSGNGFSYVALGLGDTPEDVADTELDDEAAGNGADRTIGTLSTATVYGQDDTAVVTATFNITGSFAFKEMGLFDQGAPAGTLFARRTFTEIDVTTGQQIVITWRITIR